MQELAIRVSPHRSYTPEGYLICTDCAFANLGGRIYAASELPQYKPDAQGRVYAFRDSKALFDPLTIASFEMKPVTMEHPDDVMLLDAQSVKRHQVGTLFNVRRGTGVQSDSLVGDLQITDARTIAAVERGELKELSAGFTSRFDPLGSGLYLETMIRGNHVAIVPSGRCGPLCSLRDAAFKGNSMSDDPKLNEPKQDDDVGAGGGAPAAGTSQVDQNVADLLKSIQESLAALGERVAKLEESGSTALGDEDPKKGGDGAAEPASDDNKPKTDAKPLSISDVRKAIADEFAARAEQAKADSAVIADAAVIAPELKRDTPDLAKQAVIEYAKTDSGKQVVEMLGGMPAVEKDARAVLHQCAIQQKLQAMRPMTGFRRDSVDPTAAKDDFFEKAKKMWERK
jgi:hypothetical protein